jgi:hypothetical protein
MTPDQRASLVTKWSGQSIASVPGDREALDLAAARGFIPTPEEGDILLVPMKSGKTARFRVAETRWIGNPRDMFDIERADFDGYLENDGGDGK